MNETIIEFAILFGLAAVVGLVARLLRQPLILAFLMTGLIIGLFGLNPIATDPLYQTFSDLGIMFLLFLVGMEINLTSLRLVGAASLVVGLGQVVFTFVGGFLLAFLLGFEPLVAGYIAIALTFSSTIIVVKLLSEKRDVHSLYGKISIGMLLVQDFVAILILLILAGLQTAGSVNWTQTLVTVVTGAGLFGLVLWLSRTLLPPIFRLFSRSTELLFVASLAWVFIVVTIIQRLGFSIEIGGFLAGLALANSVEHFQIGNRIKPLRDFFLLLFFVVLGTSLSAADFSGLTTPVVVLSLFVLIGNPFIVVTLMGSMGYHRRTSFLTGVTVAQISEFSLVLAALGLRVGHISQADVTLITAVGVITIALSSYLILHGDKIYNRINPWLRKFERAKPKSSHHPNPRIDRPIVLIGAHRTGQNILVHLPKSDVVIVDFDPDIVTQLGRQGYQAVYGDLTDPDLDEVIGLRQARYIISTSPDVENNLDFLQIVVRQWPKSRRPIVIMRAGTQAEAERLYQGGAQYVLVPTLMSGRFLGELMSQRPTAKQLHQLQTTDFKRWDQAIKLHAD